MITQYVILAILAIATVYFCISLYNYFKHRKAGDQRKNFWLKQSVVSFICIILSALGLYKKRKVGEQDEETEEEH